MKRKIWKSAFAGILNIIFLMVIINTIFISNAWADNEGCDDGTDVKDCDIREGETWYSNSGGNLTQVKIFNNTGRSWQINLVAATRANADGWQEIGVYLCRIGYSDCSLDPPGQIDHGFGEIAMMNAQDSQHLFTQARWDGYNSWLKVPDDCYLLINSGGVNGGRFVVYAYDQPGNSESWRLPTRDINHPPNLNNCDGSLQTTPPSFWFNDTGSQKEIVSALVSAISGRCVGPFKFNVPWLSGAGCLRLFNSNWELQEENCELNYDQITYLGWKVEPNWIIHGQAQNRCCDGVWNWAMFLSIK